ncbi:Hypothetical Protein FCC1311_072692 [Hondaea fermentalgiana]|uniref:Uncharacterized protein n=1 Tax=Hondaea fermentalgiana TaxID=2315210 RepID=A0A2R5GMU0_9STRA|nr:Hypothetical Protein FCC1311_072692 [Hondaea fermentalgiana]|eukprot:GBG31048.1 Hypothetical Protein FCC1311_072692 [Hondaea fermentalgiana]
MFKARRKYEALIAARNRKAATDIQRVMRGCWGRRRARSLRAELEARCANRLQMWARRVLAEMELARRRAQDAERKKRHLTWQTLAAQGPIGLRAKLNGISDRELQDDWKLYATTLRDALLLFAYKDELEGPMHIFDRLIRANPRCRLAYEAKAVVLLVWGGLPRHKYQHAFYFAEQAANLLFKARNADILGIPGAQEAAWNISNAVEFFYICARGRRKEYRGFCAQMYFAVALGCLAGEEPPQRALLYYARALEALKENTRFRGDLLSHHQAWVRKLERDIEIRNASKERSAVHAQRIVRGAFGRSRWRHEYMKQSVLERQGESLVLKRLDMLRERQRRSRAASRMQAFARGCAVRIDLRIKNERIVEIQRVVRGRLGRVRFAEIERRQRMGVLVTEVFRGAHTVPVVSRGQDLHERGSTQVVLQILRAGFNYLVSGTDLCTGETYHATLREQHMQRFLDAKNRKLTRIGQVRATQYERVVQLMLGSLRLCPPVKALGDLLAQEASLTFVLDFIEVQ